MTIVVVVLFSLAAFQQAIVFLLQWGDQIGLMPAIRLREGLEWHGAYKAGQFSMVFISTMLIATTVISYFGALIFYFYQRWQGLKAT
jgi:hypothetical protein